jgi:PAT family beta-lactamase induction signal transducer AmpG
VSADHPGDSSPLKRGALVSLGTALTSWRTASVSLLSFSSGLPLGLVWIAIPDWLRSAGVDLRLVGLVTIAQAPWSFKVLWSPLMDRYHLPFMGRRRGWAALTQVALFSFTLALCGVGESSEMPWVVLALALAIAVASASQDIAVDAYAVDVLRPEEHGIAVGARTALYRAAMFVAGGVSITLAGMFSWSVVCIFLACLYVPILFVTWKAPEPEERPVEPKTLREALWLPFLGFLSRRRAMEILAFVFFYKFADNLAGALLRPFLIDMGYTSYDRGVALATVGLVATLAGTFLGGAVTTTLGLGHSLWVFGFLQIFSNLGYILIARVGMHRPLMYSAITFETFTQGMGTGAFFVLLLRMTQKRFSATQYALFSSLFGLPRIVSGPISGFTVDALGWESFFWCTILAGIPGLLLLQRFSPLGVREPHFVVEPPYDERRLTPAQIARRGVAGGVLSLVVGASIVASLTALKDLAENSRAGFDLLGALRELALPVGFVDWLEVTGIVSFAVFCGLCTAAVSAARHGAARDLH